MVQANGQHHVSGASLPPPTRRELAAQLERLTAVLEHLDRATLPALVREVRILERAIEASNR